MALPVPRRNRGLDDIKESVALAAVDYAKTLANVSVRLCDPYSFVAPRHGSSNGVDPSAAAARMDAGEEGSGGSLREELGEATRTIGAMVEDLRRSEAEAVGRGERGARLPQGGLASGERIEAAVEEVFRQAAGDNQASGPEGGAISGAAGGVGRVLGGRGSDGSSVEQVLRPGRARGGGEASPPSPEAREASAKVIAVVLPWLLRKGILSRCKQSQALSMRTLQRIVKVCDKEALTPHVAELVATLIEGLSALEPQVTKRARGENPLVVADSVKSEDTLACKEGWACSATPQRLASHT